MKQNERGFFHTNPAELRTYDDDDDDSDYKNESFDWA